MRVLKVICLILFFFFCMIFFVQNTEMLSTQLVLKMDVFSLSYATSPVPFYVVLLSSFVVGGLFSALYFAAERLRMGARIKELSAKVASLEKERNAARIDSTYPVGAPVAQPETAATEAEAEAEAEEKRD